jgi:hypothetical protein
MDWFAPPLHLVAQFLLNFNSFVFIILMIKNENKSTTEGGVERTRGELDAALRRVKQLSKALREWEVRREDTRNALAASDAALQASEGRLEDMLQRTVDALVLIHERDGKRKKRLQQPKLQQEPDATVNATPTPTATATSATGNQVVVVEEEVELIMKTIVGPLLDGVGTKAPVTTTGPRKTSAAKPVKVKRSRPAKAKPQQQQATTVEPVA